ncbi:MAG TPA: type II secretion system protein N [Steroidobacteraceae bacterium]|nr:type II secretion system protein N [Steroidobacteraceae bacterium]
MKLPRALPAGLTRLGRPSAALDLLPQVVTVVAAAAIATQLALLVWKLVPGAHRPPPPVTAPPPSGRPGVAQLLHSPLFGLAPTAATGGGENAPRTRVALVLAGTLAVRDPKAGLAIVGESAQTARVYACGSTLPGGVRLHEVYTDRVVLDRDGALETLPLPHQSSGGTTARLSPAGNTEPALGDSVQRLVAQGPEVIGEVLRPMPMYANGQLKGFRVYAGRDRQKFAKLGLQPGDLVTQINGVPLGDAQHGMEILRTLGNAATANVTIERGGVVQQLTVDTAQVAAMAEAPAPPGRPPAGAPAPPADAVPTAEPPPKSD